MRGNGKLDAKDVAILEALQADGRIALSELGRKTGLSQPAMSERVQRLEEAGIISGYGARIDPQALGLSMAAIIRLKTAHEHIRSCLKAFHELPYIPKFTASRGMIASCSRRSCRRRTSSRPSSTP